LCPIANTQTLNSKIEPLQHLFSSRVLFDLVLKGEPFLEDLESLEQAVASFLHLSFVAQIKYPQVREV
jgi:hypothetical protein